MYGINMNLYVEFMPTKDNQYFFKFYFIFSLQIFLIIQAAYLICSINTNYFLQNLSFSFFKKDIWSWVCNSVERQLPSIYNTWVVSLAPQKTGTMAHACNRNTQETNRKIRSSNRFSAT